MGKEDDGPLDEYPVTGEIPSLDFAAVDGHDKNVIRQIEEGILEQVGIFGSPKGPDHTYTRVVRKVAVVAVAALAIGGTIAVAKGIQKSREPKYIIIK